MVTAEAAVVLPVLVFVLAAALAAVSVVTAQLRCTDAAREGARAAARGESSAAVREIAASSAPEASTVSVRQDGETVTVDVSAEVPLFPGLGPSMTVSDSATAALEPGVEAAPAPFPPPSAGARTRLEPSFRAGDSAAPT
ncbi:MAG: pilus assembly protein [Actinomycetota bacterium]|nr:pilus assembly protein [Actinomycetota bacterium]